jgi:uncharacterized membrane protein YczE
MKPLFFQRQLHIILYTLGFIIAALGVFLMKSSTLGLGPWGVAAFELNRLLSPILGFFTFGLAASVHTYVMIFLIIIIKKNLKSAFVFVSVLMINGMVDLYDFVIFPSWAIADLSQAILSHAIGFIAYSFGSALLILSGLPGMVIEELTFALMKVFKMKRYALMRTIVAYFGLLLALIYGIFSGTYANSATLLTIVLGVAFGPVIHWMVRMIQQTAIGNQLRLLKQTKTLSQTPS